MGVLGALLGAAGAVGTVVTVWGCWCRAVLNYRQFPISERSQQSVVRDPESPIDSVPMTGRGLSTFPVERDGLVAGRQATSNATVGRSLDRRAGLSETRIRGIHLDANAVDACG